MDNKMLKKSNMILTSLKSTICSFFSLYDSLEQKEENQNILRAIVLFSCSGVDAIVKQLINDTLEYVIEHDEGAFNQFKQFSTKKIQNKSETDFNLLTELLICENPRKILISVLKKELTQNSLQSAEELFRVASYFNIETKKLEPDDKKLREIFKVRNQITHELDVDMTSSEFTLRNREKSKVKEYSDHLLKLSENFIKLVSAILIEKEAIDEISQIEDL